jgi:hypothetical protein
MTIYQIDYSRPFITLKERPVQWHSCSAPLLALMSRLVHVNLRGIAYKPREWHLRALPERYWAATECTPSAFGLC